jgi:hypothetical protein
MVALLLPSLKELSWFKSYKQIEAMLDLNPGPLMPIWNRTFLGLTLLSLVTKFYLALGSTAQK